MTSGEKREETEWHRVFMYNHLAEIEGEFLAKGRSVYIEGRLKTRKWQDKDTGADRFSTEIVADQMQMLGGRDEGGDSDYDDAPRQQRAPAQRSAPRRNEYADQRGGAAPQSTPAATSPTWTTTFNSRNCLHVN